MGFRVFQGILDVTILIFLAVVVIYLRLVRASLQRLRRERNLPVRAGLSAVPDVAASEPLQNGIRDLTVATERAASMRDRMELLFHDAERWIEDLEKLETLQKSGKLSVEDRSVRESDLVSSSSPVWSNAKDEPKSDIEKVLYLAGQGRSVREIAQSLGRGEGEVELMLGLSRLSDGRTPSGK